MSRASGGADLVPPFPRGGGGLGHSESGRRVLIVGGGGREHAIARAIAASPRTALLHVAPGNAGTPGTRIPIDATDIPALVDHVRVAGIDLVIVGPESPLAAGLADALAAVPGCRVFGPTQAGARLESSKAFARAEAQRLGIPGPRAATFGPADAEGARAWARTLGGPVVVKESGLAGGKGVTLPEDGASLHAAIAHACAYGDVVIEERLAGPEYSLIAFTDGTTVRPLPLAQDHKRLGNGDTGPNTGGMGAYAPAPLPVSATASLDDLCATFIAPVVDARRAAGTPYVGWMYAGLMWTARGPRLLEWNCRLGDPEAQVLLPLLETDLLEVIEACVEGRLAEVPVRVRDGAALGVVLASPGYPGRPETGRPVTGLHDGNGVIAIHGATTIRDGVPVTDGGRVATVVGIGSDLAGARQRAYEGVARVASDGITYRTDIGWRAPGLSLASYAATGVNIEEGNRAVGLLGASVASTATARTPEVLRGVGAFGGALDVSFLKEFDHPVLVGSTDGVGTKVELAARLDRVRGTGIDIVNHCVNDVLVQGARPLFFLDYLASSRLDPERVAETVAGMAEACREAGCVLLGGETAEMPGVYRDGAFDIAGTLVGVVERADLLPRAGIGPGDVLIGLASNGPHTNGYSLLRRLFAWASLDSTPAPLNRPLADALLVPHRSYLPILEPVLRHPALKALVHITGGGLVDNLPRVLPKGVRAVVRLGSWPVPPLFQLVRDLVAMPDVELYRTLNMGVGMVMVVDRDGVDAVRASIAEATWVIGALDTCPPGADRTCLA